jgi:xeroderma pigmentosum group C-complementing protein
MLAEVGVDVTNSQPEPETERPLKRRRRSQNSARPAVPAPEPKAEASTSVRDEENPRESGRDAPPPPPTDADDDIPAPTLQTLDRDSAEDDSDEDIEFEDVAFEAWLRGDEPPAEGPSEIKDLEINISAHQAAQASEKNTQARRKPMTREEKDLRVQVHQTHLLCLLSHVARRNHWCNDPKVQDNLRPLVKGKVAQYLTPGSNLSQFGQSHSLKNGLRQAGDLWKGKFEITERGLRQALWAEDPEQLQDYELPDDLESCHDREEFHEAAKTLSGSRDVGAQLYCAMMRGVGVRARRASQRGRPPHATRSAQDLRGSP